MVIPDGLHRGDAATILATWPDHCAQTAVTSPPYLQQRRYGDSDLEGGLEATLDDYVVWLTSVLGEVRRVLCPDGLLWLNIGDKANGSGGAGGDWSPARARRATGGGPAKFRDPTYLDQTYLDVPGAIIRSLLLEGWRLRRDITWDKGRQAPEDLRHVGRPREQHERILLLAPGPARPRFYPSQLTETGSIWRFPPGGQGDPHLAPFPDELARRCILPSTLPGDLVIDPFAGSGTTLRVAEQLGRRAAGTDLYAPSIDVEEPESAQAIGMSGYGAGLAGHGPRRDGRSACDLGRQCTGTHGRDGTLCCRCAPEGAVLHFRPGVASPKPEAWHSCPNGCRLLTADDPNPYDPDQAGWSSALYFEPHPDRDGELIGRPFNPGPVTRFGAEPHQEATRP